MMRTLKVSALLIGLLSTSLALADNSSPGSNSSTTDGFSLDPKVTFELSPGAIAPRKYEAGVKGGLVQSNGGTGATFQGEARVPLHLWGDHDDQYAYRHGVLVEPGANVRLDVVGGKVVTSKIDATGVAAYRFQGSNLHMSDAMKTQFKAIDEDTIKEAFERIRLPLRTAYEKAIQAPYGDKVDDELETEVKRLLDSDPIFSTLKFKKRLQTIFSLGKYVLMGDLYEKKVRAESFTERARELLLWVWKTEYQAPTEARNDEVHSTGDIILGRVGYRYNDLQDSGVRQHGVVLTPIDLSGATAVRINKKVNVAGCIALKPFEAVVGENRRTGALAMGAEGCLDVTIGSLPTIRDKAGIRLEYDPSVLAHGPASAQNARAVFNNSLSVSKKLGPITPELAWTHEKDCVDNVSKCVNRNMFTAGAAF